MPFVFLANGEEVRFRDLDRDAHFRPVATVFAQEDLERRIATRTLRVPPTSIAVDVKVVGRDYQHDCIEVLCQQIELGRRKLLVEMATGTGKTRMAAALIKRLFDADWVTRVLFLVDRNTLAKQTEDASPSIFRPVDLPCAAHGRTVPGAQAGHDLHPADDDQQYRHYWPATSISS